MAISRAKHGFALAEGFSPGFSRSWDRAIHWWVVRRLRLHTSHLEHNQNYLELERSYVGFLILALSGFGAGQGLVKWNRFPMPSVSREQHCCTIGHSQTAFITTLCIFSVFS